MTNFGSALLFIFYIVSASLFITSATELATDVCKNTTDFSFCRDSVYSDPRAATADRQVLAYIAFSNAYVNATHTYKYIASIMKSDVGKSEVLHDGLVKCKGYYKEAVRALTEAYGDLDSDTMWVLDVLSNDASHCARKCEKSFHERSPMTKKNEDLVKLANICLVVSKLFIAQ